MEPQTESGKVYGKVPDSTKLHPGYAGGGGIEKAGIAGGVMGKTSFRSKPFKNTAVEPN